MKIKFLLAISLAISMLTGCQTTPNAEIVTTLFTHYDFARQIVGDKMSVRLLVPPGAEAHDYEPTSRDLEAINKSKLFIFTAYDWETWLGNNVSSFLGDGQALNLYEALDIDHYFEDHEDEDHHDDEEEHEDHEGHDHSMHFWTNPLIAVKMIDAILESVISIDPLNASFYTNNANIYKQLILDLDDEMHDYFDSISNNIIYFAGHNAMDFFAERYHLEIIALTSGFQPDADITSTQIENLILNIKNNRINVLFVEELKEPKLANTIKNELAKSNYNLRILEFHGYHNITKKQLDDKISYLDLMTQNFMNLKEALKG
jgi:zinc transport system substrate-binding protein